MTQKYKINPEKSQLIVETQVGGLLRKMGHDLKIGVRDLSGQIQFNSENFSSSKLKVKVKATSLRILNVEGEKDLREIEENMFGEILEVKTYPEILFESHQVKIQEGESNQFSVWVEGPFTLKDVTRNIKISGGVVLKRDELKLSGEFELKQTDFGIKPYSAMGGALKVKDRVKIFFEWIARAKN